MELNVDPNENLVEMPGPGRVIRVLIAVSSDRLREHRTEAVPPEPNRLMRDVDAALVEQVFNIPQRQRKTDIHHHREADDFGRSLEIPERITHRKALRNHAIALNSDFL